ncbi:pentatricopeptide repeat-containing protein At3g54980, mitochondrial-like [Olea europaea var. sylvestris]|uniref:pentatricopeptide repeat-containing protein At3g54980, mitochondrial-like n=1 Tax=Olea europaea var. sylvestris TaxID=158386 RepID=UPI000C1D5025|nr:pentatricopeptide repeat-containing protein At3g54980, mitochondrial-like [Olea europaea var. sylvestris]
MKFLTSSTLPPRLLFSLILRKSNSSSSSSTSLYKISELFPSDTQNSVKITQNSVKIQTFKKPISENRVLTQAIVIRTLLDRNDDPVSALEYYKWAEKNRGFASGSADPLGVLLHILVKSPEHLLEAKNLLNHYVCSDSVLSAAVIVRRIVNCSKRFGFELNPRVFNYLLNVYINGHRHRDAIGCFRTMVICGIMPWIPYTKNLLSALVEQNMIGQAHDLFRCVVLRPESYDCATVHLMMHACLKLGQVEEAQKYFMEARGSEIKLDASIYRTAVEAACRKLDDNLACFLLKEMKEKGLVVSGNSFTRVICTCVKQRNIVDAIKLKDEMIRSGHPMNLRVANNLMKGCYMHGDLNCALELFNMIKDELTPNEVTYSVILEGCCRSGDMERVQEIHKEMKQAGIPTSVCVVNSLIKGFLEARLMEDATKFFDVAVEAGIANVYTYANFISWFCKEGMMDKAYTVWDKMIDKGVEPTANVYNNMILGNCRKGNMEAAIDFVSEMLQKNFKVNVVTYSILIQGYFNGSESEKALGMFDHMMSLGISPTDFTFNILIRGLCKFGRTAEANVRMKKLVEMGFSPVCL